MGKTFSTGLLTNGIWQDASNNIGIGGSPSGSYKFEVTGVSRFTSNVGIGFAPNTWFSGYVALEMGSGSLVFPNNATNTQLWNNLFINAAGNPIYKSTGIGGMFSLGGGGNSAVWYTAPSGTAGATATLTQAMTLTNSGNLGIGTTSPSGRLTIYGGETLWGATSNLGALSYTAGMPILASVGALDFLFYTNSTERMRITSGGNIGLATTSPAALLSLKGRGGADIIFQMNDETDTRRCFYIPNQYYGYMWAVGVVSNGGKAFSLGNASGSEVGTIVINAGGVAYNTTSDYRLKEDLRDFNGLDKVSKIKVYDFKWKNLDERIDGVIAHELQEVLPYAVSGVKDALNHEGNIEAQSVDYSKLTPVLVKAIQELSAKVSALENKS